MFKHKIILLLITGILLLNTCNTNASLKSIKNLKSLEWYNHLHSISNIDNYQAQGTLTYVSKKHKFYAYFNLKQINKNNYYLIITNILGMTYINLNVKNSVIKITKNKGNEYLNKNIEEKIQKNNGINILLINLHKWILGLPKNSTNFNLDYYGRLYKLNYNKKGQQWIAIYHKYYNNIVPSLPSSIELKQNNKYIKLQINNWNL